MANPALLGAAKQLYQKELRGKMVAGIDRKFSSAVPQNGSAEGKASARRTASEPRTQVYAIWKKSRMSTFQGKKEIIEVPLLSTRRTVSLIRIDRDNIGYIPDRTMVRTVFDRLVISQERGSESFRSQIVRYHPDRGYLEKHHYDMGHVHLYGLDGFTGYLEYLTISGKRKAVVRVVDGKPVRRYYMGAKKRSQKQGSMISVQRKVSSPGGMRASGGYFDCWDECEYEYGETCTGNPNAPDDEDDQICSEHIIGEYCWEECEWVEEEEEYPEFCDDPMNYYDPECDGWDDEGDERSLEEVFDENLVENMGPKPIMEFNNKCTGISNIWSNYPNNEIFGYLTIDGKLIITNILPASGGTAAGLYHYDNTYYYPYPDSQGTPTGTYSGMVHSAGHYFIPVQASVHTHVPCRTDNTNGVSHPVGNDDKAFAQKYPGINHWVIGCGAVGQYNGINNNFYNVRSGNLSTICTFVQ